MTKNEKNYLGMGASVVLLLMNAAELADGSWLEVGLKWMAVLFTTICFVLMITAKSVTR